MALPAKRCADTYDRNKAILDAEMAEVLPPILNKMVWEENKLILDHGCSSGCTGFKYFLPYAEKTNSMIYALDNCEEMIKFGSLNYGNPAINYICGTMTSESSPVKDLKFNKIFSIHTLQFIEQAGVESIIRLSRSKRRILPRLQLHTHFFDFFEILGRHESYGHHAKNDLICPKWINESEEPNFKIVKAAIEEIGFEIKEFANQESSYVYKTPGEFAGFVFQEVSEAELRLIGTASLSLRSSLIGRTLTSVKPMMTKTWIQMKSPQLAGLLDKQGIIQNLQLIPSERFGFEIVSEVINNLNYSAVSLQRYSGYYQEMLRPLTGEMVCTFEKFGLSRGMCPTISEFELRNLRLRAVHVCIPPSIGFFLLGRIEFPKSLKAAMDVVAGHAGTRYTLLMGKRWPDVLRNWAHSVLFVADCHLKIVFVLDPANEKHWSFQCQAMADYFTAKEMVQWKVEEKVCPRQLFSGDCNLVTLMLMQKMIEGIDLPEAVSKLEICRFKSKLVAALYASI